MAVDGYTQPNYNRLYAWARLIYNTDCFWYELACITQLLEWKQSLIKEPDIHGWTPLHYAARFGYLPIVKQLLTKDRSVAYLTAYRDNNKTSLHLAASWGNTKVMKELISHCPDCWEMVDIKGQNILHFACSNQQRDAVNFILQDSRLRSLINQTDKDGNTPLHMLAASGISTGHTRGLKYVSDMIQDPRVDKDAFNKEKLTPLDITIGDSFTEPLVRMLTYLLCLYFLYRKVVNPLLLTRIYVCVIYVTKAQCTLSDEKFRHQK